ncbi:MAG TPA: tetratricopeptide repeat protein [Acidobacteriaceae bacterium]
MTSKHTCPLLAGGDLRLRLYGSLLIAGTLLAPAAHAQAGPAAGAQQKSSALKPDASATLPQTGRADAYYHYQLAHDYEEMATSGGHPDMASKAIEEYKLALAADPGSPFLNHGLADLYFRTGRVKDAIQSAEDQIKADPTSLEAHKLLGRIYLRSLGDMQGAGSDQMLKLAIGEYVRIVALEPDNVEDHLLLGQLYSFSHDSAHAEEQFKAAQRMDPNSEEVALNLARMYGEQGDLQRSIQVLSALPESDQTAKTEYVLGASYDQAKDTKKAIAAYRRSLDLEPDNLDVERALADALLHDGQEKEALAAYEDVAEGDPTDAQAYLHMAEIERRDGRYEEALAHLKKAQPLASDSLEISYNEGLTYDALGRYEEAEAVLSKLVADSEHTTGQYSTAEKNNRALFLDRLANVFREEGKYDLAAATYIKLADLGSDYAERGYGAAIDSYRDGHAYDKATLIARQAAEKYPRNRVLKIMYATQLADTGKFDEGYSMAKSLLTNTPQDEEIYQALAQIDTHQKKWKDAAEALDKAEQLAAKTDDKLNVYFLRGALEEKQKHYEGAEVAFRKALAIDPNNTSALNYYGYMLADHDQRLNEALSMLQKAVKLDPQQYAYLDSLGWAYFKLGQYQLAEGNLLKASQRNATEPTVHDHLGDLYEKTGRLKQAASQWEEALHLLAHADPADAEPGEGGRLQKKLEVARVKLVKETPETASTPEKHDPPQ